MPSKIGSIFVKLGLDTATFHKKVRTATSRLSRSVKKMRASLAKLANPLQSVTGALGLLGGVSFGALVTSTLQSTDALAKHADRLGLTTEALGGLRFAAQQSGADISGLDVGLQRMVRRVSDAAAGNKGLSQTFKELGLDAKQLNALSPDQQFLKIADAISSIPNQGERVRQTFKIFDTEGVKLKNLLDQGSEGVNKLTTEFNQLGGAISRADAAQLEEANDAINRMRTAFSGVTQQLVISLAPTIKALSAKIQELVQGFRQLSPETQKLIAFGAILAPAITALGAMAAILPAVIGGIKAMGVAFVFLGKSILLPLAPLGLILGAVAAIGAGIAYLTGSFDQAGRQWGEGLKPMQKVMLALKQGLHFLRIGAQAVATGFLLVAAKIVDSERYIRDALGYIRVGLAKTGNFFIGLANDVVAGIESIINGMISGVIRGAENAFNL